MKTTSQPQLPGVRDYREPVVCHGSELAGLIREATAAGYHAHRMTVLPGARYELRFVRQLPMSQDET